MFSINEVVTRIEVSVVFDHRNITACRTEDTQRMLLIERCSSGLFEYLYFDLPDILVSPFVEYGTEKNSPSLSLHAMMADVAFGVWLWLDHWQKAYVRGIDLLEEAVDFGGVPDIVRIHYAQNIGITRCCCKSLYPRIVCLWVGFLSLVTRYRSCIS